MKRFTQVNQHRWSDWIEIGRSQTGKWSNRPTPSSITPCSSASPRYEWLRYMYMYNFTLGCKHPLSTLNTSLSPHLYQQRATRSIIITSVQLFKTYVRVIANLFSTIDYAMDAYYYQCRLWPHIIVLPECVLAVIATLMPARHPVSVCHAQSGLAVANQRQADASMVGRRLPVFLRRLRF